MIRFITAQRLAEILSGQARAEEHVRLLEDRLNEARIENHRLALALELAHADLRMQQTLEGNLWGRVQHLAEIAEAPVHVLLRDGIVRSVHRSTGEAIDAAYRVDPTCSKDGWRDVRPDADLGTGWKITPVRPRTLTDAERGPDREEVLAARRHFAAMRRQSLEEPALEAPAIEGPQGGEAGQR
jgi:hypothetical protein